MALQPLASVGGTPVLYADVVAGEVVGAQLVIPAGKQAVVEYANGNTTLFSGTFDAGTHTATLPTRKQFTYATAGTNMSLTMRWP